MNEILYRILVFVAGIILGTLFFGGLWLTVKKTIYTKLPALWFVGSFMVRVGITLAGFYYFAAGNWQRMLICTAGFIAARFIILHLTKTNSQGEMQLNQRGHK